MPKLYFKYGCMNSSKTALLLMTKHNYEEQGQKVLLIKPDTDTREKEPVVRSRIGIEEPCILISKSKDISEMPEVSKVDVLIVDEAQFLTSQQVTQLYDISFKIPVLCYGLLTDFQQHLFEGSKRLLELAESFQEIKTICQCGKKATINARVIDGKIVTMGKQLMIGGNETYLAMCKNCYIKGIIYHGEA